MIAALVTYAPQAIWQYAPLRHPVRPPVRAEQNREVCGYGMRLSGARGMDYVGSKLDTLAVGRISGAAVLGNQLIFQSHGYFLSRALTAVLSSLSRIHEYTAWPREAYLRVLRLGTVFLLPVCAGIGVGACAGDPQPQLYPVAGLDPWFAHCQLAPTGLIERSGDQRA